MSGISGDGLVEADLFQSVREKRNNNNIFNIKFNKPITPSEGGLKSTFKSSSLPLNDDDDDRRSLASTAYRSVVVQTERIDEETREARIKKFYEILYGDGYTKEKADEEEEIALSEKNKLLEIGWGNITYSRWMLDMPREAFVPYHATRTHMCRMSGELSFDTKTKTGQYRPIEPLQCFGSKTEWGQGNVIDRMEEKAGILSNVYVIRARTSYMKHELPCSVGVIFGEIHGKDFVPYNGAVDYCEYANNDDAVDGYHLILPPYYESEKEEVAYKSGADVNSEYGKEYVYLTSDERDITLGAKPIGKDWLVPNTSPILKKIYKDGIMPEADLPQEDRNADPNGVKYYIVKKAIFDETVREIKRQVNSSIPVRDLNKFVIRFYPFWNSPYGKLLTARAVTERDSSLQAINSAGLKTTQFKDQIEKFKGSLNEFGLFFKFEMDIMFRDIPECAVEKTKLV